MYVVVVVVSVLFLFVSSLGTTHADVVTATWTGGGDGISYSDERNWDSDDVPLNNGTDTYEVVIPENKTVDFDTRNASEINGLTLGAMRSMSVTTA